jgi:RNA polymerase sigma-70 factor (ECF subfamily)
LADLYDRHGASLFRHALALTRRQSDAEDLVQATFLKLRTTGADLAGVRSPASYLHRMLRSSWVDGYRRGIVGARAVEDMAATATSASSGATAFPIDDAIDIGRALDGLGAAQREAVVLHLVEGFSFREIGHATGVSLFTAAARYRLGIARMRRNLVRIPKGRP